MGGGGLSVKRCDRSNGLDTALSNSTDGAVEFLLRDPLSFNRTVILNMKLIRQSCH